jgi:hypothetical protein
VSKERFRRALRGYDPDEVDAALEARDARLARLEREAQRLAERVVEREKRLQEALRRPMAAAADTHRVALSRALSSLEEVYGQARRQATRIRMKALEDAVQMADRVTELSKLRDELGTRVAELAEVARTRLGIEESQQGVYAGEVEVEVGPLKDFAQLKRFADRRATLSMNLENPVELLRELEERAPFDFVVRDLRRDGVVLDVDDDGQGRQDRAA